MLVMALLVALFVVIVVIARMVAGDGETELSEAQRAAIAEQIKPVGEVHVGSAPAAATAAAPDPEQIYQQSCFACHGTGAAGAPKVGDKAAWADRIARGKEALYKSALSGKGAMPPKGGNASLSDDTVKAVVDFMVSKSR